MSPVNEGIVGVERVGKFPAIADDGYSGKPMIDYVRDKHGWQFVSVKRTELHQFKVFAKK